MKCSLPLESAIWVVTHADRSYLSSCIRVLLMSDKEKGSGYWRMMLRRNVAEVELVGVLKGL